MQKMKRIAAWIAMVAVLLSSFAFAEEPVLVAEDHAHIETELVLEAPADEAVEPAAEQIPEMDVSPAAEIEEHECWVSCVNPGVCAHCGEPCDREPGHNWYNEEQQRNWVIKEDEPHMCGLFCADCQQWIELYDHHNSCKNSGVCDRGCGADISDWEIHHNWYNEELGRDNWIDLGNGEHGLKCFDCGEVPHTGEHWQGCLNPGFCGECGTALGDDYGIGHNTWIEEEGRDNWIHTEDGWVKQCFDCGVIFEEHECWVRCGNEGVCDQCGNPCDMEPQHDTWDRENDRECCVPSQDDPYMHFYCCSVCGEVVDVSRHGVTCWREDRTHCADCGVEVDPADEHVETWHRVDDWKPIQDLTNPAYCGVPCDECGELVDCDLHWADCAEPDKCAFCGVEWDIEEDRIWGHETNETSCKFQGTDYHTVECCKCGFMLQEEEKCYTYCWYEDKNTCAACGQKLESLEFWHALWGEEPMLDENSNCVHCGEYVKNHECYTWIEEEQRPNAKPNPENPETHLFLCVECGDVLGEDVHAVHCITEDKSNCTICGIALSGIDYAELHYTWDEEAQSDWVVNPENSNECGMFCQDCQQWVESWEHNFPCWDPSKCDRCATPNPTGEINGHNCWINEEQRDNWVMNENGQWTRKCLDCGYEWDAHDCWVRCGNEGVCDNCGMSCDAEPEHDTWDRENERVCCVAGQDAPYIHYYFCAVCGEVVDEGRHGVSCEAEDKSVCSDCGTPIADFEYDNWHHSWIDEEQRDNWIDYGNGMHALKCLICGDLWDINPHGVDCMAEDKSICSACGMPVGEEAEQWHNCWIEEEQRDNWVMNENGQWALQCLGCGFTWDAHDCWVRCGNEGVCDNCGMSCDAEPEHDIWNREEDRPNCVPLTEDPEMHVYFCDGCGEVVEVGRHGVVCGNEDAGVCADCGASVEGIEYDIWHDTWNEELETDWVVVPENPDECGRLCNECEEWIEVYPHNKACWSEGHCDRCWIELPEEWEAGHNCWNDALNRENSIVNPENPEEHIGICVDCGVEAYVERHGVACWAEDQSICSNCGVSVEGMAYDEWHDSEDWDAYFVNPDDPSMCGPHCIACDQIVYAEAHFALCSDPDHCANCGIEWDFGDDLRHMNVTVAVSPEDPEQHIVDCLDCDLYIVEDHFYVCFVEGRDACSDCGHPGTDYEVIHPWVNENGFCEGCGELAGDHQHYADCTNPGICVECGAESERIDVHHDIDYSKALVLPQNLDYCGFKCRNCDSGWDNVVLHVALCDSEDRTICVNCGTQPLKLRIDHYHSAESFGFDEDSHWYECRKCGERHEEPHQRYCVDAECLYGCGVVTEGIVIHIPGCVDWTSKPVVLPDDESKHGYIGSFCGEYELVSEHGYWYGVCVECGAKETHKCYAYCDDPGVCVECGKPTDNLEHPGTVVTRNINEYFHGDFCTICDELVYMSKHYVVCALGGNICSEKYGCGAKVDPQYVDVEHVADSNGVKPDPKNPDYHTFICRHCKKKISALHDVNCQSSNQSCYCGAFVEQGKNHYSFADLTQAPVVCPFDASKHGWICECGDVLYPMAHNYVNGLCKDCGKKVSILEDVELDANELTMYVKQEGISIGVLITGDYSRIDYASSSKSVATVDEYGVISAKKAGSANITVTVTGENGVQISKVCKLTVKAAPTKVTLSAKKLTLGEGESTALKATLSPSKAYDVLSWTSSDEAVVSVDAGVVTGIGEGSATVTVETINGKTASCTVTVLGAPAKLDVDVSELMLIVKKTYTLKAEASSAAGGVCAGTLSYESSDSSVASVDAKGKITAKKPGEATITVSTYNDLTHEVKLAVYNAPKKVTLNTTKETLDKGATLQLTAAIAADEYSAAFTWSTSSKKVATVDANGVVTAIAEGSATITVATDNGKKATCKLTIVDPYKPTGIELAEEGTVMLSLGDTLQLNASLLPVTAQSELTWSSSSKKIAEVDENGVVTPVKEGTATITVTTHNKKKDTVKVQVVDPKKAAAVELVQTGTVELPVGASLQLEAVVLPATAETTLSWSSSAKKTAEVNENGLVTAVKKGTATITVKTTNGKKDTVKIKVVDPIAPSSIELENGGSGTINLIPGETHRLQPILQPVGSFSLLSWTSLNPTVATVEDGLVTAVGAGETIVTVATSNGLTASCTFIVNVFPTQLSLNSYELQLMPGESFQLIPSVDQGETSYSYWSDDPESVSVDANGLITAIREWGSCIHVSTSNGLQAECRVSVPQLPTMVTIDPASISMGVGQTFQLHAWVDQGEGAITYASSDPFVVTVDENGLATAVGSGTAEIIATSVNGLTAGCTVNVASSAAILTPEMDEKLHADLQAAIDEIMNSDSEIVHSDVYIPGETYTGRAYYISNDGDDNNDGLTPETAWRTMFKLNYEINWGEDRVVRPGDIIYFRRGDTFRLNDGDVNAVNTNIMPTTDGITFSAYGEGPKPIITASSENGSGSEKWELAYEDESGAKIWKYYRDLMDTSTVVCNDGEALTKRVYEWWDGDEYVSCTCDEWLMDANTGVDLLDGLLSLGDTLTEDMSIVSRPVVSDDDKGPLYFRCDAGNPGAIYESIEFSEKEINGIVWLLVNDTVFDNISFQCNGNSYIKNGVDFGNSALKNTVIQNCEFAYGGGSVSFYGIKDGGNFVAVQGDGIYNVVDNATIRNNYFHDAPCSTATFESPLDGTGVQHSGYYHVLENVMVNTIGLRLDSSFAPYSYLDSVVIRGNQIWNTGRMDRGQYYYSEGSINLFASHHDEIIVEDNVIYGTENGHPRNALLNLDFFDSNFFSEYTVPQLIRNTYVQHAGRDFAYFEMQNEKNWLVDAADTVAKAIEWFGDTLSRFFIKQ